MKLSTLAITTGIILATATCASAQGFKHKRYNFDDEQPSMLACIDALVLADNLPNARSFLNHLCSNEYPNSNGGFYLERVVKWMKDHPGEDITYIRE